MLVLQRDATSCTPSITLVRTLVAHPGQALGRSGLTEVPVPADVADDCSTDATEAIIAWIASYPDGTRFEFGSNGCYRIEGVLEIRNRNRLTFDGNGATFRSEKPAQDQRAIFR